MGSLFIYLLRFSNLEKFRKNLSKSEYFHKNLRILLKTCIFAGFLCGSTPTKLDINTYPSTLHLECFLCEIHTRYLFFRIQLNIKINNQSLINHAKDEVVAPSICVKFNYDEKQTHFVRTGINYCNFWFIDARRSNRNGLGRWYRLACYWCYCFASRHY